MLLLLLFIPLASAFDLEIKNGLISPDGVERMAITPNGGVIGPLITFNKGEDFQVNVTNHLTNETMRRSTSIHWHGFFQRRTNAQDGAAFVTQCPIAPDDFFNYNFPTRNQTGTFWYHSHLSTQYCDGLRGPIVMKDPQDPYLLDETYNVDDDSTVITLTDHYHAPAPLIQKNWFRAGGPAPAPNSTLVNGVGRFNFNDSSIPWPRIKVTSGSKYRFRFVNIACDIGFRVSVEGHNLTIIEADGEATEKHTVAGFDIFAGQRYSAVLNADPANPVNSTYWIFVEPIASANTRAGRAILQYQNASDTAEPTPQNPPNPPIAFDESQLHNAKFNSPGLPIEEPLIQNIAVGTLAGSNFFTLNNKTFFPPTVPTLLQILSGARDPADFVPSQNLIVLPRNRLIEVRLTGGGTHPMHLHGHAFDVTQSAGGVENLVNPVRRDVVTMMGGREVRFRFRTDNPGPWFLHCHIDWHLEAGLALIFGEAPADNVEGPDRQEIPPAWNDLCPKYEALSPDLQ